jgi:uncharacterized protein YxeA
MKVKILIIFIAVLIAFISVLFVVKSRDIDFDVVKVEELDNDFQDTIKQIKEQNTYFIIKDKTIVVYSNLGKSGLYTYPYAEIIQEKNKLTVNIKSHMAADERYVKEILIVRINNIKQLPNEFETTFLDQKTNYKIIDLSK